MRWRLQILVILVAVTGSAPANDLYTNVYQVPPTFLNALDNETEENDPFKTRATAKDILESAGITFSPGCSAIYNASNSQLIVRNTPDQMELVEAYVDSLNVVDKQIYVTFREYHFTGDPFEGEESPIPGFSLADLLTPNEVATRVKEGERSLTFKSNKEFFEELSRPPRVVENKEVEKPSGGISGVFTDPQLQLVVRSLSQNAKIEKLDLPSIMLRSGNAGMVQVDKKRYGVIAVTGADDFTIDLQLYLPKTGKALFEKGEKPDPSLQVTIWDGQSVAYVENQKEENRKRLIFVKAMIMDPAGMPINGFQAVKENREKSLLSKAEEDLVKKSDSAALRGAKFMAEGSHREAAENYELALNLLPEHGLTEGRAKAYRKQLESALEVLRVNPGTPKSGASVHIVKTGESIYGIARQHSTSVGRLKSYNQLESDVVAVGQLLRLPGGGAIGNTLFPEKSLEDFLRKTIIPEIHYDDLPFPEALAHLVSEIERVGSSLTGEKRSPKVIIENAGETPETQITLRLANVPASEALRYTTSLARCKYRLDGQTIIIEPLE